MIGQAQLIQSEQMVKTAVTLRICTVGRSVWPKSEFKMMEKLLKQQIHETVFS